MIKRIKSVLKVLSRVAASVVIIYVLAISGVIGYYVGYLEEFKRVPTNNPVLAAHYETKGTDPSAYGLDYEEVYFDTKDNLTLSGWFIPSVSKSNKCIYFVHGWRSSAISCLPYLDIVKEYSLNHDHNIFFINLRNSGSSTSAEENKAARTDLGYKPSYDIVEGMEFLSKSYGIEEIKFFSLSMGAMATIVALNMHNKQIEDLNMKVSKVIMDSPLANAKHAIKSTEAAVQALDSLMYVPFFTVVNLRWDGMLNKLRFSHLMKKINNLDMMIMQAEKDTLTKLHALNDELHNITNKPIINTYERGSHAKIYQYNQDKYGYEVNKFLRSDS